ncbi:hypothetical protein EBU60_04450 [bacterium]|nr:hypothetical protein [bacterium]
MSRITDLLDDPSVRTQRRFGEVKEDARSTARVLAEHQLGVLHQRRDLHRSALGPLCDLRFFLFA